jgi:circadian clock protein KaiC
MTTTDNRVKTGIPEFDEMLSGGFLERDAVMVAGTAGSGKTTLGLQYLVNGVTKYDENGIYVTFEQLPDQIYRDAKSFGWDLRALEEQDKLRVVCTSPDTILASGEGGGNLLDPFIKEIHARRIVIDSLSHIAMYLDEKDLRKETYRLIMYLKTKGLSSLLLFEAPQLMGAVGSITETGTSFLVDSIIMMKPVEIESSMRKVLAILKLRGSDHDKNLREYKITSSGITLGSPFSDYEGIMSGSPRKLTRMAMAAERFSQPFTGKRKKD